MNALFNLSPEGSKIKKKKLNTLITNACKTDQNSEQYCVLQYLQKLKNKS